MTLGELWSRLELLTAEKEEIMSDIIDARADEYEELIKLYKQIKYDRMAKEQKKDEKDI